MLRYPPVDLRTGDYYLARSSASKKFNLIVAIGGTPPFFTLKAWNLYKDTIKTIHLSTILEWGPKIASDEMIYAVDKNPKTPIIKTVKL